MATTSTTKKKTDALKIAVANRLFTNPVTLANRNVANAAASASSKTALDAAASAAKNVSVPTGVTAQTILNNKPTVTAKSVQNKANNTINTLNKAASAVINAGANVPKQTATTNNNKLTIKPTIMQIAGGAVPEAANIYGISDQLKAANAYPSTNNVANSAKDVIAIGYDMANAAIPSSAKDTFNEGASAGVIATNEYDKKMSNPIQVETPQVDYAALMKNQQAEYERQQAELQAAAQAEYERRLRELQEAEERRLREQEELKRQATQSAYDNNMSALLDAYTKRLAGINENYDTTVNQLGLNFDNSSNALSSDAERALQEAYINRMMNEKSMRNQLNAQGITGGASESVIAGMLNNYANARNNIENNLADNVRTLREAYQKNLASALQNRNDALSAAEDTNLKYKMQLENDLRNNIIGSYNDLYSGLMNADANYYDNMAKLVYNQANNANELQNYAQKLLLNNNSDLQNYAERLRLSNLYNNSASTGDSLEDYAKKLQLKNDSDLAAYEQKLALQNQYNTKNTSNGLSTAVLRVLQKYNAGTMTDEDYDSLTQEEKDQFIANM